MAASYQLIIVTPNGAVYDREVEAVTATGECGGFGVLAHHAPMLASLAPGVMKVSEPEEKYFAVGAGILEVGPDGVVSVLADSAVAVDSKQDAIAKAAELTA